MPSLGYDDDYQRTCMFCLWSRKKRKMSGVIPGLLKLLIQPPSFHSLIFHLPLKWFMQLSRLLMFCRFISWYKSLWRDDFGVSKRLRSDLPVRAWERCLCYMVWTCGCVWAAACAKSSKCGIPQSRTNRRAKQHPNDCVNTFLPWCTALEWDKS